MVEEKVILVDKQDEQIGLMDKMEAHEKAVLHRAFSIFIFNSKGELMLQRRALSKYHSPALWTNTCCSHPREGETYMEAAHRRLQEEMGFDCDFEKAFDFIYKADVGKGLTEHEFDHVLIGESDKLPEINHDEVEDWKCMKLEDIRDDIRANSDRYTVWFKIAFDELLKFRKLDNA
ncbi:MAG: isopentenyl-diphosphate Delta-isomerase [Bacteroidota bacterium]|nr:isopentenyl-diphosphate Delta-isomerase [Bacteroidota bacterium]